MLKRAPAPCPVPHATASLAELVWVYWRRTAIVITNASCKHASVLVPSRKARVAPFEWRPIAPNLMPRCVQSPRSSRDALVTSRLGSESKQHHACPSLEELRLLQSVPCPARMRWLQCEGRGRSAFLFFSGGHGQTEGFFRFGHRKQRKGC